MGYEPLHHKYRPQTFTDLVGQEAIAHTLTNALNTKRIAPAYLFTGARGTGKTSSARIMAKSLNCLSSDSPTPHPCGKCELCHSIANGNALDITEIDAASNTGVDNIRELIERAQFAPVKARFKVYIIDECHMLSTAAFNALLKTLEEPPDRVTFILATTDPQRVLPTIISRCQRFDFRRIPLDSMVKHLGKIAENENINIHIEALTLVAQIAQGGLRDAESLLDQLSLLDGEITVEAVWDLVGSVPEQDLLSLIEAIAADHPIQLIDYGRRIMDRGREPLIVLQNLANVYRDLLIAKTASDRSDLVPMTSGGWERLIHLAQGLAIPNILHGQQHLRSAELQIRNSTQPRLWLEVTLMGLLPSAMMAIAPAPSHQPPHSPNRNPVNSPAPQFAPPKAQEIPPHPVSPVSPTVAPMVPQAVNATPNATPIPTQPPNPLPIESPIASGDDDFERLPSVGDDLERLWQNVMAMLPSPTKAIFEQKQAHFRQIDTSSVIIGLGGNRDEATKNIAIQKREELERVCSQVLNRPIKVRFTFVASTTQQLQVSNPLPQSPAIAPPPISPPAPVSNQSPANHPVNFSAPPVANQVVSQAVSNITNSVSPDNVVPSTALVTGQQHHEPTNSMPQDDPVPKPKGYVGLSDEERVVRNMAEFFNGQVIDLDEEVKT